MHVPRPVVDCGRRSNALPESLQSYFGEVSTVEQRSLFDSILNQFANAFSRLRSKSIETISITQVLVDTSSRDHAGIIDKDDPIETEEGYPVQSFQDLLSDLATLTRN